ncbi:MAG: hypothetical protein ACLQSX_12605, partial [Smithella sp.]
IGKRIFRVVAQAGSSVLLLQQIVRVVTARGLFGLGLLCVSGKKAMEWLPRSGLVLQTEINKHLLIKKRL